jgi:hypothetical protein
LADTKDFSQGGPARIVSYSHDPLYRNFTLAQQGRNLIMRLRTTKTDLNGTNPEVELKNVFLSNEPYHIAVTYDFQQESIYFNGQLRLRSPVPGGKFSNWDPTFPLILGNENTGNRPWNGQLFLVAIYNRTLSGDEVVQNYHVGRSFLSTSVADEKRVRDGLIALYLFNQKDGFLVRDQSGSMLAPDLYIPKDLKIFKKETYKAFLGSHFTLGVADIFKDIVLNTLAFILFGFLLHRTVRKRFPFSLKIAAIVLLIGFLFSLTIESLQYFLESRGSEMIDVISGTIGVALGIMVCNISE